MIKLDTKLILLLAYVFAVLSHFVVDASPAAYRRNNDTSQVPVPTELIDEFKLWVQFASASYCNVTGWNCGIACKGDTTGTRLIKFFSNSIPNGNNGYVAINDKHKAIIVAYRGTADFKSFATDLRFDEAAFPSIPRAKVHFGFLAVYNDTKEEITKLVKSLAKKNPKYTIVNVGHSLGGSLAVFQTLDLLAAGLPAKRLMTFTYGQPRTGNDVFAKHVESLPIRLFRVVNKNDIIPQIPPVQFGYAHTVPEYWITPSNEVVKCQKLGGNNCSASQGINLTIVRHAKYFDTAFLLPCLVK